MKRKIFTIVSVLLVAALLAVCMIACVPKDAAKAEANLKENGYTVVNIENSGLAAILSEAANYVITDLPDDWTNVVNATKSDTNDGITLIYCESKDSAKKIADEAKKSFEEMKKSYKESYEQYKDSLTDEQKANAEETLAKYDSYKIGASGKVAYYGTEDAYKAL